MAAYNTNTEDLLSRQIHPILANTAKDGSGTFYFPLVDADGKLLASISAAVTASKTATIDIDRESEFSGDDVDRYSSLVDLGGECSGLIIVLPTIDTATVTVYGQDDAEIDTVPASCKYLNDAGDTLVTITIPSGTGAARQFMPKLGYVRYIRLLTSADQTADRAITVIGVR